MDTRWRSVVLAVVFVMLVPGYALADAPPNDTFETATVLSGLPYSQAVDLTDATDDPNVGDCESFARHRIWYRYTAPEDQVVQLSVGVHGEDVIRVEYAIWNVTDGDPSAANLFGCATEGNDLIAQLKAGQSYAFVLGQDADGPPWFSGTLTVTVVPPPVNDDFANAAAFGDGDSVQVLLGTILAASRQSGEPVASCDPDHGTTSSTMWYRFTVPAQSSATVFTQIGGVAAIYSGDALGSLSEVGCTPDQATTFDVGPGTYSIQLSGRPFQTQGMTLRLDLTIPPPNDDFAHATSIDAVPYQATGIDLTLGTVEAGEPTSCSNGNGATAWWTYTAPAKGQLTFYGFGQPLGAWAGTDLASLTPLGCSQYGTTSAAVNAGDVVHLQLAGPNSAGPFGIQVDFAAAPANDDFADATAIGSLPFDADVNLSSASFQPGEPGPSCYGTQVTTVWYGYTATDASTTFNFDPGYRQVAVAAYTGTSLAGLTQIGCASAWSSPVFTIKPAAGTTVWIQVAISDYESFRQVGLHGSTTPAPIVDFFPGVADPSIFTDIPFYDATNDPGGSTHTVTWTFGDGSASTDQYPSHRYARDGAYDVTLVAVTADGRTGSATKTISVRTHDVEIVAFDVPASARSGQTKTITVGLGDRRYREVGSIQLLAIRPGGSWEVIDQRSGVSIPVTHGAKTTDIEFRYRFTTADAAAGKVSFRVLLTVDGVNDVAPGDNEIIAPPTFVKR